MRLFHANNILLLSKTQTMEFLNLSGQENIDRKFWYLRLKIRYSFTLFIIAVIK